MCDTLFSFFAFPRKRGFRSCVRHSRLKRAVSRNLSKFKQCIGPRKGIWNPGFWNPEFSSDKESGIPQTIRIQNPSSTDKDWNPLPGIRNPQRGVQNPRLSWISLHHGQSVVIDLRVRNGWYLSVL